MSIRNSMVDGNHPPPLPLQTTTCYSLTDMSAIQEPTIIINTHNIFTPLIIIIIIIIYPTNDREKSGRWKWIGKGQKWGWKWGKRERGRERKRQRETETETEERERGGGGGGEKGKECESQINVYIMLSIYQIDLSCVFLRLMELESSRDDLLYELHKQPSDNPTDNHVSIRTSISRICFKS